IIEHGCETDRAQHPEPVLGKTRGWIADRANDFCLQIGAPTNEIDHFILLWIEEHPVDGEIAPLRVFFRRRKPDVDWVSMIEIRAVRSKRGDFEIESVLDHNHDSEVRADGVGA